MAERFLIATPHLAGQDFTRQSEMMIKATDVVLEMIKQLRSMKDLEKMGCAKGFNALKLSVVERILWAWVLTLPASAAVAYLFVVVAWALGWLP